MVNARQGLLDLQTRLQNRDDHAEVAPVQKMHDRLLKKIALEIARLEAAIAALIKTLPSSPRSSRACRGLLPRPRQD
jgi:transposase